MRAFALLLLTCIVLLSGGRAEAAAIENRAYAICRETPSGRKCEPMGLHNTSLRGPGFLLVDEVWVAPERVRSDRPMMVLLIAMASSEVRWNGALIGTNGRPGPDRASEVPGRFVAVFAVPPELVKPGRNVVTARVSSHHLPLPVRNAVHFFEVHDYVDPLRFSLMAYLPALLTLGVLALAGGYFAVTALLDRAQKGALLLSGIAATVTGQLALETVRGFINYPYPWHVARVGGIALLAAATAVLIAAWAAQRFRVRPAWAFVGATAVLAGAAVLFHPGYDGKAGWATLAGFAGLAACAADGLRRREPGAVVALGLAVLSIGLWFWSESLFLDRSYYLLVAAVLATMVAGQVLSLRAARRAHDAEAERAKGLAETLARREAAVAVIRDGTRVRRVPTADILCLRAADDYCEVRLADGRQLLSTATLAQTLADLPGEFVRVHKSWAVNAAHVASIGPAPGGRRAVTLDDGSVVPVGRAYAGAAERLSAPVTARAAAG